MKICTKCKIEYPLTNYHRRKMVKSGYDSWCKGCKKIYRHVYFLQNRDKEVRRSRIKAWKNIGVDITYTVFEDLAQQQNQCCAICNRITSKLNVDHNHTTGKIRKLLCGSCNRGLGLLQEDVSILQNAIDYLKAHQ